MNCCVEKQLKVLQEMSVEGMVEWNVYNKEILTVCL